MVDGEAQVCEEGVPEGVELPEAQHQGKADPAPAVLAGLVGEEELPLVGAEIARPVLALAGDGLFAAVAADELRPVRKGVDGELAVVAAALTELALRLLMEGFQLLRREEGAFLAGFGLVLAVEGGAVGAHEARDVRADDLHAHLLLKGTEDGLVVEGAALDHHVAAQLLRRGGADDLVEGVLHHADGEARGDVLDAGPVLLGLLDAGVHEDGAAAAEIHGTVGKEAQLREVLHLVAQGMGEGLQEAAAAGGAGFVEEDVADGPLADLEALHVLAADVDDEVHLGQEVAGGGEVGHRLHHAVVGVEGGLRQVLAVAGGGDGGYMHPRMLPAEGQEGLLQDGHGAPLVGLVVREEEVPVLVDDRQLHGGGAGVDADMYRAGVVRRESYPGDGGPGVAGSEGLVLRFAGKERGLGAVAPEGLAPPQALAELPEVEGLVGVEGRAHGHVVETVLRAGAGEAQSLVKAVAETF